jgi:hypothetical protein
VHRGDVEVDRDQVLRPVRPPPCRREDRDAGAVCGSPYGGIQIVLDALVAGYWFAEAWSVKPWYERLPANSGSLSPSIAS